jgi:hypothetical protein
VPWSRAWTGLADSRPGRGVQAHRVSTRPLARRQRPHLVALVRAGATFINGKLAERPDDEPNPVLPEKLGHVVKAPREASTVKIVVDDLSGPQIAKFLDEHVQEMQDIMTRHL